MDVNLSVKKAYDAYKKVAARDFLHVTTTQLNVVYNVLCRMKRDEEYRNAILDANETGDPLDELIERYLLGYNNLHGLDITKTLTVFDNPDFAVGSYFEIRTYLNGEQCSPIALHRGDVCHVHATHISRDTENILKVPRLRYVVTTDEGNSYGDTVYDTHEVEFDLTLAREGGVRFKIFAEDEDGKVIIGSESAYGGVLYDIEMIKPTHKAPEDLESFWMGELRRLMDTDPLSTVADGYCGRVAYEYDMPKKNCFSIKKVDAEYLAKMKEEGLPTLSDEKLSEFDIYELYLKAPGPCPSTAYVVLPKRADAKSLPLSVTFDGYSAHTPAPIIASDKITIHCTHHGYELCKGDSSYYNALNGQGILGNYGRGNGKVNSDYKDVHDCYLLYMLLRNLQMIRLVADRDKARVIPNLSEYFSGEVMINGGSMGGYQTTCVGGLCELLGRLQDGFKVKRLAPSIPAFCNIAGPLEGFAPTGLHNYEEGCDYFDAAILASFIDADVTIPRVGLGDETCPHTGITAMVNNIPKGKEIDINYLQNSSHGYVQDPELQKWYKYAGKE